VLRIHKFFFNIFSKDWQFHKFCRKDPKAKKQSNKNKNESDDEDLLLAM
jgi:hypothetical protein